MDETRNNYSGDWCLHLSVTTSGLVSLWDTARKAQHVKGESYVCLELSSYQVQKIDEARRELASKDGAK